MRKKIIVNGEEFTTKASLKKRVQSIIARHEDRQLLGQDDFDFMCDLLCRHPDYPIKRGNGLDSMWVDENSFYPGRRGRGFFARRLDGSVTDFSYNECITPSSLEKKVKAAFRHEIQDQLYRFKQAFFDDNGGISVCPGTGEEISFTHSHVDHVAPLKFEKLLHGFFMSKRIGAKDVTLTGGQRDMVFFDFIDDEELASDWRIYHAAYAVLEVVSPSENLSTRNKENA